MIKAGIIQMLSRVIGRCFVAIDSDGKQNLDGRSLAKSGNTILSWCIPVFKSFSVLCSQTSACSAGKDNL